MPDWILSLPAAVKLGLVLLTIVGLMRVRVPMGVALVCGTVLLAVLFPMTWGAFGAALLQGLIGGKTIFLLVIVVGILIFSGALNATGQIARIIDSFKAVVGESRITLVTFPALIGLLPMPGGAIFSAPMVEAAAGKAEVTPARRSIANYWFRHIWEYWFPLYPGVILALELTSVSKSGFILLQLPLTFCALALGYVVILHHISLGGNGKRVYAPGKMAAFLKELTPILIVLVAVAFLSTGWNRLLAHWEVDSFLLEKLPILAGLILGGVWLAAYRGLNGGVLKKLVLKRNIIEMALLAVGVMMFQTMMEHCGAADVLRMEFEAWHVPLVAVVCLLPFIAGVVVGIAIGYVGASFPLVIALLEGIPADERLPYYALAYSFGYVGMMLSPVHMCLVLTNEYFKARLMRVYAYLIPLGAGVALASVIVFLTARAL